MRRFALGFLIGFGLVAVVALADVWNATWETRPAGTELASDLDLFIQEFKTEVRQRLEVEHLFGPSTDDNGLHDMGSARVFHQTTAPTDIAGGVGARGPYVGASESEVSTLLTTDEPGPTTRDIGAGRLWLDSDGSTGSGTDDRQLQSYDETANGFLEVRARDVGAGGLGANNLVYNGSFEITDGSGALSALVPAGWSFDGTTPTTSYLDPTAVSEGEGIAVRLVGSGGADERIIQTLSGLKASTTYVVRARVRSNIGTCSLVVTGGAVTPLTATSAVAAGTFATLEVEPTTTAVPANLVIRLESDADLDSCDWDHVVALERYANHPTPGVQTCRQVDSTDSDAYYVHFVWADATSDCAVTPPGPGYVVLVRGSVWADNDDGNVCPLGVRITENGVTVAFMADEMDPDDRNNDGDSARDQGSVQIFFMRTNPTPGTTLTYSLEATNATGVGPGGICPTGFDRNEGNADGDEDDLILDPESVLEVVLIPTR